MRTFLGAAALGLAVILVAPTPAVASSRYVSIGANCAKTGARSQTRKHVPTVCVRLPGDRRPKWHTAPIRPVAPPIVMAPRPVLIAAPVAAAPVAAAQPVSPCAGQSPVVCHYDVAPGFYSVSIDLVGSTSIYVEARRKMQALHPSSGIAHFAGTVSVRNPEGQPTGADGFGSPGLTIAFTGAPSILNVRVTPAIPALSLFLVGDSTVADLEELHFPKAGWGQEIPQFFGPDAVVANYADSGESAASYLAKPELFNVLERQLTPGSLVLIQFGHNDTAESATQYRSYLTEMVTRARARRATPVLVTSPVTRNFSGAALTPGALHRGNGTDYPAEMKRVAAEQRVPLIDLTTRSASLVESLGAAGSAPLYASDNIHPTEAGSDQFAQIVATGLRDLDLVPANLFR
jgi:lysophospholipase L1-like esterase